MITLFDVLLFLLLLCVIWLFWQHRRQTEHAYQHALWYCKQQRLQMLDLEKVSTRWSFKGRHPGWRSRFVMGFSSDCTSRYEGTLTLHNSQLIAVDLPPFREPN